MSEKYKDVSKEKFDNFVSSYPKPLEMDVTGICEPPVLSYNDFTKGDWPDSVVATVMLYEDYPKDGKAPYRWAPNIYSLISDEILGRR